MKLNAKDTEKLNELRTELSQEWNKPKAKNIESDNDKREPRSPKRIKELQTQINSIKSK